VKNKCIEKISYNLLGFSSLVIDNSKVTYMFVHGMGGDLATWDEMREMI